MIIRHGRIGVARHILVPTAAALAGVLIVGPAANAAVVFAVKDTELTENGGGNDAGSGAKDNLNARWNPDTNADRNEWVALQFDLSGHDKSLITGVTLEAIAHRGNSNSNKNLRLFAHTVDWDEASTTFSTMPGLTWDDNAATRGEDLNVAADLGAFNVTTATETAGEILAINPASLTSFINGMGSDDLLTILISFETSSNGQWRIASREATELDGGAMPAPAGTYAARLSFEVIPEPSSLLLLTGAATGLFLRRR